MNIQAERGKRTAQIAYDPGAFAGCQPGILYSKPVIWSPFCTLERDDWPAGMCGAGIEDLRIYASLAPAPIRGKLSRNSDHAPVHLRAKHSKGVDVKPNSAPHTAPNNAIPVPSLQMENMRHVTCCF